MKACHLYQASIAAGLLCFTVSSCRTIRVKEYTVPENDSNTDKVLQPGLQQAAGTLRIAQISDFHSNNFGKNETLLLEKIKAAKPDIIVFTGDTFDFKMREPQPVENVKMLLEGIRNLCPFLYVSGNHEYFRNHNDEKAELITHYGGIVLRDTAVRLDLRQGTVIIAGVSDPFSDLDAAARKKKKDNKPLYRERIAAAARAAGSIRSQCTADNIPVLFTLLLAHRPEYISDYCKYNFNLILSGHAHGGMWRIPGLVNGLYAPSQGIFPKYAGGRYDFDNGTVFIISRGLSYQRPFFPRIFNSPELVVIDVRIQ